MALTYRTLIKNLQNITKTVKWSVGEKYPLRTLSCGICYHNIHNPYAQRPAIDSKVVTLESKSSRLSSCYSFDSHLNSLRLYSTQSSSSSPPEADQPQKQGIIKRFKRMYRDYWYVLIPVHMATSAIWFGSFYYLVRSGVDVLAILSSIGISESLLGPLRDSSAGYFAIALAIYKLVTPLRYAVTVGGTTLAIRKLTGIGFIKPVPSRERIKELFQEKKENLQDAFNESKTHYKAQMKEKSTHVMQEMKRYKTEMRNLKNKVKKV